jgi:SAM-dependent methyltransferase
MAMPTEPIRFSDGAGYDRFMGVWSRLAGQDFLDWIGPSQGQRWLDVGCGNGAFTQLIAEQCEPLKLVGIDPSEAQLTYARQQPLLQSVESPKWRVSLERAYTDCDDLWTIVLGGPSAGQAGNMPSRARCQACDGST